LIVKKKGKEVEDLTESLIEGRNQRKGVSPKSNVKEENHMKKKRHGCVWVVFYERAVGRGHAIWVLSKTQEGAGRPGGI